MRQQDGEARVRSKSGDPLIECRNLEKVYGTSDAQVKALAGVNLQIKGGEFVAIMGPSGSGKSTTMNILGCLDVATGGQYLLQGVDVGRLSPDERALVRRHLFGFVFQGFNLLARTTASENVELPLTYRGTPKDERRVLAAKALARVGLAGRENHTSAELSGGQQQRVAIARAIVTNPRVLIADEPTGNLDTHMTREIMNLLTDLNRDRQITIIMVTHEPEVAAYADRIIKFVDGKIESDVPRENFRDAG
jgi:putative ABC transport system ATP-binding protein